jgi:choline dehydrogenase
MKVVIKDMKAVGVELTVDGERRIVFSKEVIVSAGTFQSPQLLMLSGIGDAAELKAHNITVIVDK